MKARSVIILCLIIVACSHAQDENRPTDGRCQDLKTMDS